MRSNRNSTPRAAPKLGSVVALVLFIAANAGCGEAAPDLATRLENSKGAYEIKVNTAAKDPTIASANQNFENLTTYQSLQKASVTTLKTPNVASATSLLSPDEMSCVLNVTWIADSPDIDAVVIEGPGGFPQVRLPIPKDYRELNSSLNQGVVFTSTFIFPSFDGQWRSFRDPIRAEATSVSLITKDGTPSPKSSVTAFGDFGKARWTPTTASR